MTLQKGLVGHWTMDDSDTSGGVLYDNSAYDNHGTLNGGVTTGASSVGDFQAYTFFDGDYIETGADASTIGVFDNSSWSVSLWVNLNSNGDPGGNVCGDNRALIFGRNQSGGDYANIDSDSNGIGFRGSNLRFTPTLNQWYHIIVTYDHSAGEMKLYRNGVLYDTDTSISIGTHSTSLRIGGGYSIGCGADGIDGDISNVRAYNRILSADEANDLYQMREQKSNRVAPDVTGPKAGEPQNLMDWADWSIGGTGSIGNFSNNGSTSENSRIAERHPYDETQPVWYGRSEDTDSGADGGWNYAIDTSKIDNSKKYRYTIWVKQEYTNGTVYHGTDSEGNNVEDFSGTVQGNPYFWSGDLPRLGEWFLIAGYVHPASTSQASESEIYDIYGNTYSDQLGVGDYRWVDGLSGNCNNRSYYYYDQNVGQGAYFADPRFEAIDGDHTTISELLNRAAYRDKLKSGLVGNFFIGNNNVAAGDFIDKSSQENNATGSGTPVTTSGNLYQALDADGTGTVTWDSQPFRDAVANGEWTITLWIKQDVSTDAYDWRDLIGWGSTGQRFERGNANASTNQDYWCNLGITSGSLTIDDIGVSDNTWWHCAIRVSKSEGVFEIYVNGSVNESTSPTYFSDPGVVQLNQMDYGGDVEDLRFYKRALSQEEIQMLYDRA